MDSATKHGIKDQRLKQSEDQINGMLVFDFGPFFAVGMIINFNITPINIFCTQWLTVPKQHKEERKAKNRHTEDTAHKLLTTLEHI